MHCRGPVPGNERWRRDRKMEEGPDGPDVVVGTHPLVKEVAMSILVKAAVFLLRTLATLLNRKTPHRRLRISIEYDEMPAARRLLHSRQRE